MSGVAANRQHLLWAARGNERTGDDLTGGRTGRVGFLTMGLGLVGFLGVGFFTMTGFLPGVGVFVPGFVGVLPVVGVVPFVDLGGMGHDIAG